MLDNNFIVEVKIPYTIEDRTRLQIQQVKQQQIIEGLGEKENSGMPIFGKHW